MWAGVSHPFRGIRPAGVVEGSRVFNGIRPSVVAKNSHVFRGVRPAGAAEVSRAFRWIHPVGVIRLLRDLSYFGNRFIEKQKSRHFCNFFAIRDSFLFLQSGNRLPNGRLPAFLHRNPRSGEPITIPNRKKVAIRADFLFSVPLPTALGWCRGRGDPSPALRDGPGVARVHAAE